MLTPLLLLLPAPLPSLLLCVGAASSGSLQLSSHAASLLAPGSLVRTLLLVLGRIWPCWLVCAPACSWLPWAGGLVLLLVGVLGAAESRCRSTLTTACSPRAPPEGTLLLVRLLLLLGGAGSWLGAGAGLLVAVGLAGAAWQSRREHLFPR